MYTYTSNRLPYVVTRNIICYDHDDSGHLWIFEHPYKQYSNPSLLSNLYFKGDPRHAGEMIAKSD